MDIPRQTECPVASALLAVLILAETRPGMFFGSPDPCDTQRALAGWPSHRIAAPDDNPFAELFFTESHAFAAARNDGRRTLGRGGMIAEPPGDGAQGCAALMARVRECASGDWRRVSAQSD